jgi:hypothetical protein
LDYMSLSSRTETNDLIIFFEVLGVLVGFWTRGFCTLPDLGGFLLPRGFLYRIILIFSLSSDLHPVNSSNLATLSIGVGWQLLIKGHKSDAFLFRNCNMI